MNKKLKRVIVDVDLSPDWSHIAYTDESAGGAASLMNEAYVLKGLEPEMLELNDDQKAIIEEIGEEFFVMKSENTPTPVAPENENPEMGKEEEDMSETTMKEMAEKLEAMTKALATEKSQRKLIPFGFAEADTVAVAKALAVLSEEDADAVLKAMETLKATGDAAVEATEKALETKETVEENPVAKALSEEAGDAGEVEVTEKSFAERVKEASTLIK